MFHFAACDIAAAIHQRNRLPLLMRTPRPIKILIQIKQFGNIQFLILTIGGVVFFTLLLVTGNTMAIAVRERIGELAVLKAIGYSDGFVLRLILAESLMVAAVGGVLGMLLAKLFTLAGDPTRGLLPFFYLPASAIVAGMVTALAVGIIAGMLPAVSAMRLRVVDALRRV